MGFADFIEKRRKKNPPIIGNSGIPAYCLKKIGSRHILLAGGGGAAKTGVKNEIETHLLTTNLANPEIGLRAECVDKFNTDTFATMNMDIACVGEEQNGKYVIAAGHDQFCDLYITRGYKLTDEELERRLAYDMSSMKRIRTDEHPNNSYQKCVRFDRNSRGRIFATGGADGNIRIWDARVILRSESENEAVPLITIKAHKNDVDDLDFGFDSQTIISIGSDGTSSIWCTKTGEKLLDLPFPSELSKGFKMRSIRCTNLGAASNNNVFVAAYNSISRSSKDMASYVALWAFNMERKAARPFVVKIVAKGEAVSSLAVSDCGNFVAIGTMSGGVAVFDTHEFKRLLYSPETHGIFVTGLEFVNTVAGNISDDTSLSPVGPGAASGYQTTVLSLSADQSVQLHRVPFAKPTPFTEILLIASLISLFLWYFLSFFI
ncbi:unnamed protein product [Caenorhabditis angaria]|uniref:Uncharacterized protein n=1 Tax=Caenorhabditis angaria TaxID=860376 RepID=A0A9P1I3S4_9PELO|nr:unnamed protein product [Caenorhabditis angaria]